MVWRPKGVPICVVMLNMSRFDLLLNWSHIIGYSEQMLLSDWLRLVALYFCRQVPCGLYQSLIELSWTNISDWKLTQYVWCEEILYEVLIDKIYINKTRTKFSDRWSTWSLPLCFSIPILPSTHSGNSDGGILYYWDYLAKITSINFIEDQKSCIRYRHLHMYLNQDKKRSL